MNHSDVKLIVKGKLADAQTRCVHYHSTLDVIAIKFKCCDQYYACYYCHQQEAGHASKVWEKALFGTNAVLCGVCLKEMTIAVYKNCNNKCPFCKAPFNPKCINHDHLYFEQ